MKKIISGFILVCLTGIGVCLGILVNHIYPSIPDKGYRICVKDTRLDDCYLTSEYSINHGRILFKGRDKVQRNFPLNEAFIEGGRFE